MALATKYSMTTRQTHKGVTILAFYFEEIIPMLVHVLVERSITCIDQFYARPKEYST